MCNFCQVKHLRDWLRTNHHLKAESSTQHLPAIQFLNLKEVKPIEFSKAVSCSFNDVICQVGFVFVMSYRIKKLWNIFCLSLRYAPFAVKPT